MKAVQGMVYNVRDVFSFRELMQSSTELYGDSVAFLRRIKGDTVEEITYSRAMEEIRAYATYLNSIGLGGKKIAVIGKNSYEWALTYLAVCCGVGIIVPIDKELKSAEIENIFKDCGASAVVYSKDVAAAVEAAADGLMLIKKEDVADFVEKGKALIEAGDNSYDSHVIDNKALGILLYTSGTTGVAKGVMLSQYNICSDIVHICRRLKVTSEDRVLSILPLHHTYECCAGFLTPLYCGASIAYNESLRTLLSDFKIFRPTVLLAVPLIVEKFHSTIMKKYSSITGGRVILSAQKAIAGAFRDDKIISRKIFSEIHKTFGGRLRAFICGAASLSPSVYRDITKFGIDVYVGYGLTETSPVCIMHNDFYRCADDIGFPIVGVEAKIVDPNEDGVGELAVRGANIMLGYYNRPEESAKVLRGGWFYTGDLARQKENGAYCIVGRIKSMIVTKNGKKIFPEEIEYYMGESPLVLESMAYGSTDESGETVVGVSIYPDYERVNSILTERGITEGSENYEEEINAIFKDLAKEVNKKLPSFKHIRKTVVRKTDFEKTTTKKIKRFAKENRAE